MTRKEKAQKLFVFLMALALIFSIICRNAPFVRADTEPAGGGGDPQAVSAVITRLEIQQPQGNPVTELDKNAAFFLAMDWEVADSGAVLHEGDYFDITLPDNMRFPPNFTATDFDMTDENGNVIAHGHITPGPADVSPGYAGGKVRVTFNDNVNDKYNVHGTLYLYALFNKEQTQDNEENTFTVSVDGTPVSTTITVTKVGLDPEEVLGKWGEEGSGAEEVVWYVRVNYKKADLRNAVITDALEGEAEYIPGSFTLREVEFNDEGGVVQIYETLDANSMVTFGPDNKSFTIDLGSPGGKQYALSYRTTYTPGTTIRNHVTLTSDATEGNTSAAYFKQGSGGTAGGELAGRIKLIKVDAGDNTVMLPNAVFTVTKPDGSTFELTTGADGTVTSDILPQGEYKVKEKDAPAGYLLNDTEFTLQITSEGGAIQQIADEPVRISISVTKKWVGPAGTSATVHLLADQTDTGKTLTLTEQGGWTGSFEDLRQYKADGSRIVYTLSEADVPGYGSVITGDAESGFVVTNTKTETGTGTEAPHTGDGTDTGAYLLAAAVSFMMSIILSLRKRQARNDLS